MSLIDFLMGIVPAGGMMAGLSYIAEIEYDKFKDSFLDMWRRND